MGVRWIEEQFVFNLSPMGLQTYYLQLVIPEGLWSALAVQFFEILTCERCVPIKSRFENILELFGVEWHPARFIGIEIGFQVLPGPHDKVVVEFGR